MYLPAYTREDDRAALLAFMRAHPFATLVTAPGGRPFASHLPLLIDEAGDELLIRSHMARANEQWRHLEDAGEALVIFQGPHALVDSAWYLSRPNVPTWNYVAVHASVSPRLLPDTEAAGVARRMVAHFTPQAPDIPAEYEAKLLRGVVTFELRVTRLEGKYKLSQNKDTADRAAVIAKLERSEWEAERETAALMRAREEARQEA